MSLVEDQLFLVQYLKLRRDNDDNIKFRLKKKQYIIEY